MKNILFLLAAMMIMVFAMVWNADARNKGEPGFGQQSTIEYNDINNVVQGLAPDSGAVVVSVRHNFHKSSALTGILKNIDSDPNATTTYYISCGDCIKNFNLLADSCVSLLNRYFSHGLKAGAEGLTLNV